MNQPVSGKCKVRREKTFQGWVTGPWLGYGTAAITEVAGTGSIRNTYKRGQILHRAAYSEGSRALLGDGGEGNEFIAERAKKTMRNNSELFRLVMAKPL